MLNIEQKIAAEIAAKPAQVQAAVALLDEGATVPFIARYRKEATGGLDDTQLRLLEERLRYLRELEDRRAAILASIEEQGKLSDALKQDILDADTKARLEDLYLPYKLKRRTKAQIAREAGLEPLAHGLRDDPSRVPEDVAVVGFDDIAMARFCNPPLTTVYQDTARAGELLVDTLLKRIHEQPAESAMLPAKLVVRRSSGA